MRQCNVNIRCSEEFIRCLKSCCDKYKVSQSDLITMLVFAFNDFDVCKDSQDKMFKYIVKHLKFKKKVG